MHFEDFHVAMQALKKFMCHIGRLFCIYFVSCIQSKEFLVEELIVDVGMFVGDSKQQMKTQTIAFQYSSKERIGIFSEELYARINDYMTKCFMIH